MKLIVAVFALICSASAEKFDKCSWGGESYWCSSLRAAKDCRAFDHCMMTVWASQTPEKQNGEICDYCKSLVSDVRDFISSNQTEAAVQQFLDNACSLIPVPELATDCQNVIDQNLPEVFKMLESQLDPVAVCSALGLCAGFPDKLHHTVHIDVAKMALRMSPLYKEMTKVNMKSSVECDLCKLVMGELQMADRDHGVQTDMKNFIKGNLCAHLGSMKQSCDQTVDEYTIELFELLASELDPSTRCRSLAFCPSEPVSHQPAFNYGKPVKASAQCILCEYVLQVVDQLLKNNHTEPAIENALDKVCSLLPSSISLDCQEFVNTYTPVIVQLLAQEVDPKEVCTMIGLCQGTRVVPKKILKELHSSEVCGICETIIQYLDSLLEENSTVQVIEGALMKVCNFLPDTIQQQCDDFVKQYGPAVIQLVAQLADPKEVCASLKLCTYGLKGNRIGIRRVLHIKP